ncbi:MAG: hypothetical protein FWG13_04280 [Leptospirales bacterium]|nr:hypothetical protein [Leptospirales bacterium]
MKRNCILALLCFFVLSCRDTANTEWYDANTLRITANGTVEESDDLEESVVLRTEKACRAARLNAMAIAAVTLGEAGSSSVTDFHKDGVRFSAFVRGGSVLSKTFNPESNECTVVYELKEKGLKEKAKRASRQK